MVLLNKFLLCLLFNPCLVLSGTNCSYGGKKDTDKICFVTSKDTTISNMLTMYFKESLITNKSATAITFLRIANLSKGYELRIGSVDAARTKSFLSSKREKVYGFTKHRNNLIFLFGKDAHQFFSRTTATSKFIFFEQSQPAKRENIAVAPTIQEPIVYVYKYQNGIITLIDRGRFSLLK